MAECPHDLAEKETACADGYCPLCLGNRLNELADQNAAMLEALRAIDNYYWPPASPISSFHPLVKARAAIAAATEQKERGNG